MGDTKSEFVKAGVTLCTNCVHAQGLGYFDHCYGTPKKESPDYIRGGVEVTYFHPQHNDFLIRHPYLREVNKDGKCQYFKEKPPQPDKPVTRSFLAGLRRYF